MAEAPEAQQAQIPFALVPSLAGQGQPIDYTTRAGIEIYKANSKGLYNKDDDLFDIKAAGLHTFLGLLGHRANTAGWSFEVCTTVLPDGTLDFVNGSFVHLLTNHGELSMEQIRKHAAEVINGQSLAAQENMQMVEAIINSLTLQGYRKVQTWKQKWHIAERPSAFALIKLIIRESYIDTNATTRILRENLSSLPDQLNKLGGNITDLNEYVLQTVDQLAARGEYTQDLIANLFKAYLSSSDNEFREYIKMRQEEYDDGHSFSKEELMNKAANKYKILVQSGKWMAQSEDEKKIIALEAKIAKLEKQKTSKPPANTNKTSNKGKNKGKENGKKKLPDWVYKFPGKEFVDSNKSKTVDGKEYWWCKNHKRFVQHKTSDCKAKPQTSDNNTPTPPSAQSEQNSQFKPNPRLVLDE